MDAEPFVNTCSQPRIGPFVRRGLTIHHAVLTGSMLGIPEFASNAVPLKLTIAL